MGKKRHTQKAQLLIELDTKRIMATYVGHGQQHDFSLFKQSRMHIHPNFQLLADSGYQGLARIHDNCQIPNKKTKYNPLTKEHKTFNQQLSRKRIFVENVIRSLKIFKILALRYRNRRKRFTLRFNLIAAIYNSEIIP